MLQGYIEARYRVVTKCSSGNAIYISRWLNISQYLKRRGLIRALRVNLPVSRLCDLM